MALWIYTFCDNIGGAIGDPSSPEKSSVELELSVIDCIWVAFCSCGKAMVTNPIKDPKDNQTRLTITAPAI